MKFIISISLMGLSLSAFSQTIEYAKGEFVDCDTAQTNLALAMCSLYLSEQTERKLDSIYSITLDKLDTLILEDDELKKELLTDGDTLYIQQMTNYRRVKEMVIKSHSIFKEYIHLETIIKGKLIGTGRERSIHANMRRLELLGVRIRELEQLLEYY